MHEFVEEKNPTFLFMFFVQSYFREVKVVGLFFPSEGEAQWDLVG